MDVVLVIAIFIVLVGSLINTIMYIRLLDQYKKRLQLLKQELAQFRKNLMEALGVKED